MAERRNQLGDVTGEIRRGAIDMEDGGQFVQRFAPGARHEHAQRDGDAERRVETVVFLREATVEL